jgi:hypothetical protein
MAGYSGTPLSKKIGIKENSRAAFVNEPPNFRALLGELPQGAQILQRPASAMDLIILFVREEKELAKKFSALARNLLPNGMLWVAWPKKSSGVATDLIFDSVQRIGLASGLVDVKICAIDDTWSGLKFVYRLVDRATLEGTEKKSMSRKGAVAKSRKRHKN